MKRIYRALPMLLTVAVLLLTAAVRLALPTAAADSVILMVTGYKINAPRESSMPFFKGGQLYVPGEMFATLGLTVTEQPSAVLLSNMKSGKILYFDAAGGTATDVSGKVYPAAIVRKNGLWFVPAAFTSERLDLTYAYHDVTPAPFVRITYPEDNLMSDDSFLRYYRSTAPDLLSAFSPATTPKITTPPPVTTPPLTAPPATTTPRTTPPATPVTTTSQTTPRVTTLPTTIATTPPTTPPPPAQYRVRIVVDGLSDLNAVLAALQERGISAVFRVFPNEVAENGENLRRIIVAGHRIAFAGNANTTVDSLNAANEMLFDLTRAVTRLTIFAPGEAADPSLADAGYLAQSTHAALTDAASSISAAVALLEKRGSAVLLLPSDTAAAALQKLHAAISREAPTYPLLPEFGIIE